MSKTKVKRGDTSPLSELQKAGKSRDRAITKQDVEQKLNEVAYFIGKPVNKWRLAEWKNAARTLARAVQSMMDLYVQTVAPVLAAKRKGGQRLSENAATFRLNLDAYVRTRLSDSATAIAADVCNTATDSPAVKWMHGVAWNTKNKRGHPRKVTEELIQEIREIIKAEETRRAATYKKG